MKNNLNSRNGYLHLYNPAEEGLGSYDMHYVNAYKRDKVIKNNLKKNVQKRYAA